MSHPDDFIYWADGTSCYRSELPEFSYMSDDFKVIPVDSPFYDDADDIAAHANEEAAWNAPEHVAYLESLCQHVGA